MKTLLALLLAAALPALAQTYTSQSCQVNAGATGFSIACAPAGTIPPIPPVPPDPPKPPTCTTSPNGAFSDTVNRFNPAIPKGGFVAYSIPIFAAPVRAWYQFTSTQDTRTQSNLGTQFAVSTCPGDFNVAANCQAKGVADTGSTNVQVFGDPAQTGSCVLKAGVQYYLSVQNVTSSGAPACNTSACYMYVSMSHGFYSTKGLKLLKPKKK